MLTQKRFVRKKLTLKSLLPRENKKIIKFTYLNMSIESNYWKINELHITI